MICSCGATFEPPRVQHGLPQKYCSARCRGRYKMQAWRANNPARVAAHDAVQDERRRRLNAEHPEISKAREAARYAANRERQLARVAAYRSVPANRSRGNAGTAAWRAANPEKNYGAVRRWEAAHPESVAHYQAGRRARKRGNGGRHTLEEWRQKCAAFGYRCAYCGQAKPLTRDHNMPLSRGGTDDIMNIVPACRLCNSKKRTKTAVEFLAMPVNDASNALVRIA